MSKTKSLVELASGEEGKVVKVSGGAGAKSRLENMGVRAGVDITKVSGIFAHGPVTVRVARSTFAIGFGMAEKVIVEVEA